MVIFVWNVWSVLGGESGTGEVLQQKSDFIFDDRLGVSSSSVGVRGRVVPVLECGVNRVLVLTCSVVCWWKEKECGLVLGVSLTGGRQSGWLPVGARVVEGGPVGAEGALGEAKICAGC